MYKIFFQFFVDCSVDNKDVKLLFWRYLEVIFLIFKLYWKDNGRRICFGEKNYI